MIGHQPLLALRRKGLKPARGVRIDAGLIDPQAPLRWSRERWPMAVVRVPEQDAPQALDLRFARALPVLLVADASLPQAWFDALFAAVTQHQPASLTVLLLSPWSDENGSGWEPIDAFDTLPQPRDCSPVLTYAKAFS